ncbi:hypothetical protein ACFYUY_01575 [Kitasatospora sp. NPDC004745]|uniref:hypothetical protein n=1 Tax=Kitasatospora sp. NPDC004745 TaxID=3364019 RepID=UPI00368C98A9
MAGSKRTPRERIERAFHVSFMLPEQAAQLLDEYAAQVRDAAFAEGAELIQALPPAAHTGPDQHWYRFGQSRAASALLAAREQRRPQKAPTSPELAAPAPGEGEAP